jgi:hypothetical protein
VQTAPANLRIAGETEPGADEQDGDHRRDEEALQESWRLHTARGMGMARQRGRRYIEPHPASRSLSGLCARLFSYGISQNPDPLSCISWTPTTHFLFAASCRRDRKLGSPDVNSRSTRGRQRGTEAGGASDWSQPQRRARAGARPSRRGRAQQSATRPGDLQE